MGVVYRNELSSQSIELEVRADLTDETIGEFRTALYAELQKPHHRISLNFEKVHIINSAALGAILLFQTQAREEGMEIVISKCSDELRRTIMAIRLDRLISVEGEAPPTITR